MPIQSHVKAYTIVDLAIAPLTGDAPGALVDVPGIQSLTVNLTNDVVELRGDNKVIAIVDQGNGLEWSMEEGGLSMAALQVITGKTFADTGTTPNIERQMNFLSSDTRPYFLIVGKSLSDDGLQDLQTTIWKAKATDNLELSFQDGEFLVPSFGGIAIGRGDNDRIMTFLQHETAQAIEIPA